MKNLIIFALATWACFNCAQAEDMAAAPKLLGKSLVPDDSVRAIRGLGSPAARENDTVTAAEDAVKDETPKEYLDGKKGIPKNPVTTGQSVSESIDQELEVKDGQVLNDKTSGQKTVIDEDGKKTVTKFGNSPVV